MTNDPRDSTNEADLARFHEQHMDDETLWKKPGRTIRSRRGQGPSVTFTIRLTGDELTRISKGAFDRGTTPSDFIRSAALRALEDHTLACAERFVQHRDCIAHIGP